jgi:hypothetical protein
MQNLSPRRTPCQRSIPPEAAKTLFSMCCEARIQQIQQRCAERQQAEAHRGS